MGWTTNPSVRAVAGEAYAYDANYAGVTAPHFFLQKSPAGMTVNADTGLVAWTPPSTAVGIHEVVLSLLDTSQESSAPVDSQTWRLMVVLPYVVPAGRSLDLMDMMPRWNVQADEADPDAKHLEKFLASLQVGLNDVVADIDRFTGIYDVDSAPEKYVDLLLESLGNPFSFQLDLQRKRALVQSLPVMWQKLGTVPGIVDTIRFFLGITVTVNDGRIRWILDESLLGADTVLGNTTSVGGLTFTVVSPIVLDAEQRAIIEAVCDFVKPAHTIFAGIEEP